MKKIIALIGFIVLLIVIAGIIGIPVGQKIKSEEILGERISQDSQTSEQILQIKGLKYYYFLLSPDGPGTYGWSFYKFYLKKGGNKIHLSHIPFTPQKNDVLKPVLPVQESKKWIAAMLYRIDRNDVDVEITIFDEIKICKTLIIKGCIRTTTSIDRWTDLFNYGITFKDGNTKIIFHTIDGERVFDISKEIFENK